METQSVSANLLVEELQLGEQLNHCIHNDRRSDFALMLSMLANDVRAHSQFNLPQSTSKIKDETEELLRASFDLPKPQALALKSLEEINHFSQSHLIHEQQLETLHLLQALSPKPLAFRNDKQHIESTILSNTSLYCQSQHQTNNGTKKQSDTRLSFNVNEWLKAVQTTIVKAPLMETSA